METTLVPTGDDDACEDVVVLSNRDVFKHGLDLGLTVSMHAIFDGEDVEMARDSRAGGKTDVATWPLGKDDVIVEALTPDGEAFVALFR